MKRFNFFFTSILIFAVMLLIGSAIATTVSYTLNGINGGSVWWGNNELDDPAWDNLLESCGASLLVDILDDDGNIACTFSLSISRSHHGKHVWEDGEEIDAVRYSGYAGVYAGANWEGKGNARVKVPGWQPWAEDENPGGAVDIGGDGEPDGAYAWDSCLRSSRDLNREAHVTASCFHGGIPRVEVGIHISGF
ncbi:MAG: hypothetical protein OXI43_19925 [Candidatus Poribacteria bacterium]|nr:hypothetical protein [Candidatus Poribacteria bacterium]